MVESLEPTYMTATGNRFALFDGIAQALPSEPARLAQELCADPDFPLDGVLLVGKPSSGGDCTMVLYNKDGSRPEMCGNGLRCVGKLVVERKYVKNLAPVVETDAGARVVRVSVENGVVFAAQAEMGAPRVARLEAKVKLPHTTIEVHLVDMGNPHCVLFVDDVDAAPVLRLGPVLEKHSLFKGGTNVEFVEVDEQGLRVRFWERGVGETASCGSGASAAAVAAMVTDRCGSPVHLRTQGGSLVVEWEGKGVLRLSGRVDDLTPPRKKGR